MLKNSFDGRFVIDRHSANSIAVVCDSLLFQLMWLSISVFSQLFNYFLPDDQRIPLAQRYMIVIRTVVCSSTKRLAFLPPSGSIASTEL